MYCNILVTKPFDQVFTYKTKPNQKVKIGNIVKVSFGRKRDQIGIVYELLGNKIINDSFKIKEIDFIYEEKILNANIIKFINWISDYTLAPKGLVLKLFLVNNNIINHQIIDYEKNILKTHLVKLNKDQEKAYKEINKFLFKKPTTVVLEGVTGSGKTEVYFEAVKAVLKKNKQILIMIPEISLTSQLESRFKKRFGFSAFVWHSKISEKNRKQIWQLSYSGEPIVVIGARSSLFLPFKSLGLIVVDEEHDISYKQEDNIRYQARDLAIVRSKIEKFPIVLSSATPSIETQNNINKKKFSHVFLPSQFSGLDLPKISLVDLKKEKLAKNNWISKSVLLEIKKCMENDKQALIFLNRRGYSPLSLCSKCGYRFHCNNCSAWLVMHKNKKRLLCHHCGQISELENHCPSCKHQNSIKFIGPGIERIEEEIKENFPNYFVSLMSSDNANTPLKIKKIINDFDSKKINILIATQIMSKGYHFSNLSLVCIIDADAGLVGGDVKAIERTYNLLEQVSGRAGRSKQQGKVIIQTYFPKQPIIQSLMNRNRKEFIEQCLLDREQFNIPPFSCMTAFIISGSSKSKVETYANNLVKKGFGDKNINILGPVEAPLYLLRGLYRYRVLIKAKKRSLLNNFTRNLIKNCPTPSNLRLIIDVDPYTFL